MGLPDEEKQRAAAAKRLAVEAETLQQFKQRVDALRAELAQSTAGPQAMRGAGISRTAYGRGFAEAADLARLYDTVRTELETFSRALGDQIEALSIAVGMAGREYTAVDGDAARRLRAIQRRAQELYRAPADGSPSGSNASAGPDGL